MDIKPISKNPVRESLRSTQSHPTSNTVISKGKLRRFISFLKKRWWLVVLLIAIVAVGVLAYGYIDTKNRLSQLSEPGKTEAAELTTEISKYIMLPDEEPTLATVSDVEKLQSQEFFKSAQDGDKVLIYAEAGRALLYRPSSKKVIEYSKVDISAANQ